MSFPGSRYCKTISVRKIILFFCLTLFLNSAYAQSKHDWRLNRYYLEIGPLAGTNKFFHKKIGDYPYPAYQSPYAPSGIAIAAVVGGTWFQFKGRFFYNSDQNWPVSWTGAALLFGLVKHYQHTAFDFDIGLGYQQPSYKTSHSIPGRTFYTGHKEPQLGIVTELHLQFMATAVGISPFVFGNFNLKAYSMGLGVAVMLGKTGYSKKQWHKINSGESSGHVIASENCPNHF